MAGLFERMGLVRTEYEGMPEIPMQPASEPMYAPETPVIDATQVSYDDVIASIYQQGDIDDENSIFKIKAYIDILPQDMTKAKKQASIAGQLDVAATWQPYLSYATENGDAHIMFSTTASKSLIMDGIVFRSDFAQAHPDVVTAFIDGIFQANAMYTTEFDYIRSVMPMFAGVSDEEIKAQCGDAEMMGYAENKEVLDSTAPSVYFDMCDIWESLGETVNRKVAMTLFDNQYLLPLASEYSSTSTSTSKPVELTEEQKQEIVNYEALLTKSMTVEFVADTAQFKNPEEAYAIMDEFVSIANTLDGAIIQVEGNINARNYSDSGQALSAERAKAVAKYFIACGIDPNRLITVGNGNTKMVADPGSADAYLNRRTDVFFKIIEE